MLKKWAFLDMITVWMIFTLFLFSLTFISFIGPSSAWILNLWRSWTERERNTTHTCSYDNSLHVDINSGLTHLHVHSQPQYSTTLVRYTRPKTLLHTSRLSLWFLVENWWPQLQPHTSITVSVKTKINSIFCFNYWKPWATTFKIKNKIPKLTYSTCDDYKSYITTLCAEVLFITISSRHHRYLQSTSYYS